jgi:hypothetical protein
MIDAVFNAYFQVVSYDFFETVMGGVVVFVAVWTLFIEPFDML